ncbi:hypothetical protein ACX3SV_01195 [Hafnia paralvei]
MVQEQLLQIVFWLGVIISLPTFYRFVYAGSALIWRKAFPTRDIQIQVLDENHDVVKAVTLKLERDDGLRIVKLIDDALAQAKAKS